jgi:hypothetical protein
MFILFPRERCRDNQLHVVPRGAFEREHRVPDAGA